MPRGWDEEDYKKLKNGELEEETVREVQETPVEELDLETRKAPGEPVVENSTAFPERIKQYREANKHFDINPDLVYEPANGNDVSSSVAFPEAEVLYVEVNEAAVEQLQEEGYQIIEHDANKLGLSRDIDLTILMNAYVKEEEVLTRNKPEYVFANNYLGNAADVEQIPEYETIGLVDKDTFEVHTQDFESPLESGRTDNLYILQRNE